MSFTSPNGLDLSTKGLGPLGAVLASTIHHSDQDGDHHAFAPKGPFLFFLHCHYHSAPYAVMLGCQTDEPPATHHSGFRNYSWVFVLTIIGTELALILTRPCLPAICFKAGSLSLFWTHDHPAAFIPPPPRSSAPALPTCHACLNLSSRRPAFPFASRRCCLLLVLLTLCLNGTPHFTTVR